MNKEEFKLEVEKLGLKVTPEILEKLDTYCKFLIEYNTHTNLTAIKDEKSIYLKHFYDSLTISKVIDLTKENTLLDIGTGAGFPGMVLKIFFPNISVTLIDSNNKKIKFLQELKEKINVDKLNIINNRVEAITPEFLNYFDVVTSRAVASLSVLAELSLPLVKENKYFIPMKGSNQEEITESEYAINYLNSKIINKVEFPLYKNTDFRTILKIKKLKSTNLNNLRTYDKIIKKPLQKRNK
jgi:16S rRNA (guanine527-N7)-methyltransferase